MGRDVEDAAENVQLLQRELNLGGVHRLRKNPAAARFGGVEHRRRS